MSQRITIQIKNKIATCLTELPIVCGNSDYVVDFIFDAEWDAFSVKTARFKVNGEYTDIVFNGNVCEIPIILDAKIVWVGVFAGDLSTSTSALVYCRPSILDGEDVPAPPREDVYSQIIKICEEAVDTAESAEKRAEETFQYIKDNPPADGEKGEKGDKGEKGEQGIQGEQGVPGVNGKDGADGYTPIRGVDYWTKEDVAEIHSYVDEQLNGVEETLTLINEGGLV